MSLPFLEVKKANGRWFPRRRDGLLLDGIVLFFFTLLGDRARLSLHGQKLLKNKNGVSCVHVYTVCGVRHEAKALRT